MKPSEYMKNFSFNLEIDVDYVKEVEIKDKRNGQTIYHKSGSEEITENELGDANWKEMDGLFVSRDITQDPTIRTCFGLTMEEIQKRIQFYDEHNVKDLK